MVEASSTRGHNISLLLLAASLAFASEAVGQGRLVFPFVGYNSATPTPTSDTLLFGRIGGFSYCVDATPFYYQGRQYQEYELPPPPPSGVFDVRSMDYRTDGCGPGTERTQGLKYDIRGSTSRTQIDTFEIDYDRGGFGPMRFSWPNDLGVFCDSARLIDIGTEGLLLNVNMLTTFLVSISNASVFPRVMLYGAPTISQVSPANGTTVPPSLTLSWNARTGATLYHVQVATDSFFTTGSIVVNDSSLTGTSRAVGPLTTPVTYYWRVSAGTVNGFTPYSAIWRFTTGNVPAAPTLLSPPNGSTGVTVPATLRWRVSTGAATYHVQVSTDSLFGGTLFLNDSTLTDTTRVVTGLSYSTKYFWRVRGKNAIGIGGWAAPPFSFTTQYQPPPAPTLQSPPNGQINVPTSLTVTWNPVNGAFTYRVQVATDSLFSVSGIVVDDSTLTVTSKSIGPLLTSARYFWRVNAKNPGGSGLWSSVWNFTTVPAPPPAPTLLSPPNYAQNVSLFPTMTWSAVSPVLSYRLQVALDSLFAIIVIDDSTIPGTSRQIGPLVSSTTYYWHVKAKNVGGIGPWSAVFRFTTTQAPPAPTLVLPVDSARQVSATPTLVWSRVASATSYILQIATSRAFTSLIVNDSTVADSFKTVAPLPYGAILYWRVFARNSSGSSDPSSVRMFTVMLQPPGVPTQLSPWNNWYPAPTTIQFRWSRVPLAEGYELQIAFDTLCTNMYADTTVFDTVASVNVLPNVANYWRVRAFNVEHNFGPWTSVRRYTTGGSPAVPTLIYPANGDTGVARNVCFRWSSVPGAETYKFQLATYIGFLPETMLKDTTVDTTRFCPPTLLPARMSLFWRVASIRGVWQSPWSLVNGFTTGTVTEVVEGQQVPTSFVLYQNYPNPFNPSTQIQFSIPSPAHVTLAVYDMLGQELQTLVAEEMPAGIFTTRWQGERADGEPMSSGIYLVRMIAVDAAHTFLATRKMMLLR